MGATTTPSTEGSFYTSTKGGTQTRGTDPAYWPITSENPNSVIYSQYRFHWWVDENNDSLYPTESKSKIWFMIQPVTWVGVAGYNYCRGCRYNSILNITYNGKTDALWPWTKGTCRGYAGTSGPTTVGTTGRYWYYEYDKTSYGSPNWYKSFIVMDHTKGSEFTVTFNINEGGAFKQNSSWTFTVTEPIRDRVIYVKDNGTWKQGVPYVKKDGQWIQNKEIYVKDGSWKKVTTIKS